MTLSSRSCSDYDEMHDAVGKRESAAFLVGQHRLLEFIEVGPVLAGRVDYCDIAFGRVHVLEGKSLILLQNNSINQRKYRNHFSLLALDLDDDAVLLHPRSAPCITNILLFFLPLTSVTFSTSTN
jgi:hypothetical protein